MIDTPETDKQSWWNHSAGKIELCPANFARNLERARDAFEQRLFDVRDVLCDAMPDANAPTKILAEILVKERDEAVRACEIWQDGHSRIVEDRNYWRAEAKRWRALSLESVDEVEFDDQTAPHGEWWEVQK